MAESRHRIRHSHHNIATRWQKKRNCTCEHDQRGMKDYLVRFLKCEFKQDIPPYLVRSGQSSSKFWALQDQRQNLTIYDADGDCCFEYDLPGVKVEVACLIDDCKHVWNSGNSAVLCLVALLDTQEVVLYHASRKGFDFTEDTCLMYGRREVFPLEFPPTSPGSYNQWGPSTKIELPHMEQVYDLIKHRIAQESLVECLTRRQLIVALPFLYKELIRVIIHYLYPNEFGLFWRSFISISAIDRWDRQYKRGC